MEERMPTNIAENSLLRLPQVLELIPISRSAWWQGCKSGKYPRPIKLGPKTTVGRASDIAELIKNLSEKEDKKK
jgi:predicted DNA-binding transcriptional regulator AlpA